MALDQLTPEVLTPRLRVHLGEGVTCRSVERGPVGNGQEIWFIDAAGTASAAQLVLRRTAPGGPLEWTDRGQEFTVMRALAAQGLPVPQVHWYDESDDLGRPYFVMQRAAGLPAMSATGEEGARTAADLGRQLARVHRVDLASLDVGLPAGSDTATATVETVREWRARYRRERVAPVPLLGGLLAWLEEHAPQDSRAPTLLWGDPGRHNSLAQDGRITALLDWELTHVGHPLEDLAIAVWMELDTEIDPEVIIAAYADEAGEPVDRSVLDYFLVLACVTRSAMVVAGVESFVQGRTNVPSTAALGLDLVAVNLLRAAELAGWTAPATLPAADQPAPETGWHPTPAEADDGVAAFLLDAVLPTVSDRRLRRQVKTAAALLRTSAHRVRHEPAVLRGAEQAREALFGELASAGLDPSGGLESVAERVERDPAFTAWRDAVRSHVVAEARAQASLLTPLRDLYGGRR